MRRSLTPLLSALVLLAPLACPADGDTADPVVAWSKHIAGCARDVFSLEAAFTQETIHATGKASPTSRGRVRIKRKGLLRIYYDDPPDAVVACDGTTMRTWNPETNTVYEMAAERSPLWRAFAFALSDKSSTDLEPRFVGGARAPGTGEERGVLELKPPGGSTASRIILTVEPSCPPIKRVTIIDRAGTATRITLDGVRTNVGMKRELFSFPIPQGAKIVRP